MYVLALGLFSENGIYDISTNQRCHMTKTYFLKGCACPDDNFKKRFTYSHKIC